MSYNLTLLLQRHINKNISEVFISNLYENNFQFINWLDLQNDNLILFYYNDVIVIVSIDINNKETFNILNKILDLNAIKIYNELHIIKKVYNINIDTKSFKNKDNCVKINETKLKINSYTLKDNKLYELFVSSDIYPQLILIKEIIDKKK